MCCLATDLEFVTDSSLQTELQREGSHDSFASRRHEKPFADGACLRPFWRLARSLLFTALTLPLNTGHELARVRRSASRLERLPPAVRRHHRAFSAHRRMRKVHCESEPRRENEKTFSRLRETKTLHLAQFNQIRISFNPNLKSSCPSSISTYYCIPHLHCYELDIKFIYCNTSR